MILRYPPDWRAEVPPFTSVRGDGKHRISARVRQCVPARCKQLLVLSFFVVSLVALAALSRGRRSLGSSGKGEFVRDFVVFSSSRSPHATRRKTRGITVGSTNATTASVKASTPPTVIVAVDAAILNGTVPGAEKLALLNPGPGFCNASAPIPAPRQPRAFAMSRSLREHCRKMRDRPDGSISYESRDWCWAWMKYQGCYWTSGHWSWWEAQERIHQQGRVPDPREVDFQPLQFADVCEKPLLGQTPLYTQVELDGARKWFTEHVAMYVLSLPSASERWAIMENHLSALGLAATRILGVDMTLPGALEKARKEGLIPPSYDVAAAETFAGADQMGIAGTLGVASAHFKAFRAASARRKQKPLVLILEDDVQLVPDFTLRLWRLLSEAPCDWTAISLKSRCPYGECVTPHLTRVRPDGNEPVERCRHGVNYGFYAMLYRSATIDVVAQQLSATVWQENRPRCLDVDVALASISENIPYYAVPAVQQPGFLREGHLGSSRYNNNFLRLQIGNDEA